MPLLQADEPAITPVGNFQFNSNGTRVAVVNSDSRSVDILDVSNGRRLYSLPDERGVVWWLAWQPDGWQLAVARETGTLSLWNLREVEATLASVGLAP
jgi:WD40 repeat protein